MNENDDGLGRIAESYYRREWERWPSAGSRTGLVEYDDRLEIPTADLFADQIADLAATRRAVESLAEPKQDSIEALDRMAFLAHIDQEYLGLTEIQHWRTDAIEPVESAIGAIFGLLMRRDVTKLEAAEAIYRRLAAMPAYLEAARRNLQQPIRMWVLAAKSTALGGIEFLSGSIPQIARQHRRRQSDLERGVAAACESLQEHCNWLDSLTGRPLPEDPAVGEKVLNQIVHNSHGLPYSLDELDDIAHREMVQCKRGLAEIARGIDKNSTWQQILERGRAEFAAQPRDLMKQYREATYGLRDQLVNDRVLDLPPGEVCDVISTPAFLHAVIPSAAYSSPGPLDDIQRGIYYVSEPPAGLPAADYQANLGQHFCFESTCAHEAYPGHHVQLCWANHASSLARQMAHHIIFMEGWTLYCEQLVVDLGYLPGPIWQLDCLLSRLWRACRIHIDVGVHTRRMSIRDAIEMLKRELGFTQLRAETELNWYTQSPGTPMSYLLGREETLQLRTMYQNRCPRSSLRDFHNWLLRFGSVPQRWLHAFLP